MGLKCVVLPLNLYYDLKKTMKHSQNVVSLDKNLLVVSETIVHLLRSVKVMTHKSFCLCLDDSTGYLFSNTLMGIAIKS